MFVPLTPLEFRRRACELFARKTAVIDGDRRFTYAEFGERASRLANALRSLGLKPDDRVAFLAYNSYPLLEGYFGVLEAGGILLPLNIRLASPELAYILSASGARFLFADADFSPLVASILPQLESKPRVIWLGSVPAMGEGPEYDDLLQSSSAETQFEDIVDENAVAELFYTSGTTGTPKGVTLTHRNLYLHAFAVIVAAGFLESDVHLHTIPLFHVNGWGTPQALTAVGGTHVMLRRFEPGEALRLVEAEGVTRFFVVPTMLTMILNSPELGSRNIDSLRTISLGGAPAAAQMVRQAESALDCQIVGGYGLSETCPIVTYAVEKTYLKDGDDDARLRRFASAGLPLIGSDVRIVDDFGLEVDWNGEDTGEVVVRGNGVMAGYWKDEEATAAVIRDGWFHTGDIGVIDPEGYVSIVDRKKDIIISGGENISSVEIEKVIYEHPDVLENAVIGVPDDQWGEVPKALIVLRDGRDASAEGIVEYCRGRLAPFKIPHSVEFLEVLPKGGTGKILKRQLRDPYWSGREKQVQ